VTSENGGIWRFHMSDNRLFGRVAQPGNLSVESNSKQSLLMRAQLVELVL